MYLSLRVSDKSLWVYMNTYHTYHVPGIILKALNI